jgi:hypothetical protein
MTVQFHEGQDVEVTDSRYPLSTFAWRKAWIVARQDWSDEVPPYVGEPVCRKWLVQFPDGTRAVFDAEHIREVSS